MSGILAIFNGINWSDAMVFLTIVLVVLVVISWFLFSFFARRFKHKETMAAIEKGIPLSEIKPKGAHWITNISIGIGFIIISLPFLVDFLDGFIRYNFLREKGLQVFAVFFAIGAAFLVRGLLQRKIQR